jgi:hypothetical protein
MNSRIQWTYASSVRGEECKRQRVVRTASVRVVVVLLRAHEFAEYGDLSTRAAESYV